MGRCWVGRCRAGRCCVWVRRCWVGQCWVGRCLVGWEQVGLFCRPSLTSSLRICLTSAWIDSPSARWASWLLTKRTTSDSTAAGHVTSCRSHGLSALAPAGHPAGCLRSNGGLPARMRPLRAASLAAEAAWSAAEAAWPTVSPHGIGCVLGDSTATPFRVHISVGLTSCSTAAAPAPLTAAAPAPLTAADPAPLTAAAVCPSRNVSTSSCRAAAAGVAAPRAVPALPAPALPAPALHDRPPMQLLSPLGLQVRGSSP